MPFEKSLGAKNGLHKVTLPELANGIIQTERAIRRCKEIIDNLGQPKTVGLQAVAATRGPITHA